VTAVLGTWSVGERVTRKGPQPAHIASQDGTVTAVGVGGWSGTVDVLYDGHCGSVVAAVDDLDRAPGVSS